MGWRHDWETAKHLWYIALNCTDNRSFFQDAMACYIGQLNYDFTLNKDHRQNSHKAVTSTSRQDHVISNVMTKLFTKIHYKN